MKYLKKFESIEIDEDILLIKDIFQDMIDKWELHDISQGEQPNIFPAVKYTKIEYKFISPSDLSKDISQLGLHSDHVRRGYTVKNLDNFLTLLYFNLAGPNDFFTTRNKFIEDVELFINHLKSAGFKVQFSENKYSASKFILVISL